MYIKSIEIKNIGPVDSICIEFPVEDGRPKPIIIVGENGTGKSILLSHLVNSLIVGKQEVFDDSEVEHGKVYKYRSPSYIRSGKDYSLSSVKFHCDIYVKECQLKHSKDSFVSVLGYAPEIDLWNNLQPGDASVFISNFDLYPDITAEIFKRQCCLYFPVNRFEDPAWLNVGNLKSKASYSDLKRISRYSNRDIICTSPLKNNKDWLLDLIFDRSVFETQIHNLPLSTTPGAPPINFPIHGGFSGQSTKIYEAVLQVLRVVLRAGTGNIRLGAGSRKDRQISVMKDELVWVPNLFQLSTGEVQLLNLFISILRDYDLSEGGFNDLSDIKGVVIIDEIDAHLHASHQKEVLPELIASFPGIQFIMTTHSPLFLLGLEARMKEGDFLIYNMPSGEQVLAADFSEFNAAYDTFKETVRHREELREELEHNSKPIVFVEGDYDIRYLTKAAELLGMDDVLARVRLKDGCGFGNLDKVWRGYDNHLAEIIPCKIILLYDCDTKKPSAQKGLVYKRVIPSVLGNPLNVGIENLFSNITVQRVEEQCPHFIDTQEQAVVRVRGDTSIMPAVKSVNKDEKGNMCNWLCEHGTAEDFSCFRSVFSLLDEIIGS